MSSEVCASSMLSFVHQIFRSTNDYGALTIRELRNKYSKHMGIKALSHEEKETFRAIVDQAIMEHEVEKDELKKTTANSAEELMKTPPKEEPKDISESPFFVKRRIKRISLSESEGETAEIKADVADSNAAESGSESQSLVKELKDTKKGIGEKDEQDEEKENEDSDERQFFVKKKKKKHKLKRYSLDKECSSSASKNDEGKEEKSPIPRIKLVRDYSSRPKSDSTSDIDEFINSVVKAATGGVSASLKSNSSDVCPSTNEDKRDSSCAEANKLASSWSDDAVSSAEAPNKNSSNFAPSNQLHVSRGDYTDGSDTDDQPLANYRKPSSCTNSNDQTKDNSEDVADADSCSKRLKLDPIADGDNSCDVSVSSLKDEEDSNSTVFSVEDGTAGENVTSRKRKRSNSNGGTKKNSEDRHIQRYKRYLQEAGIRFNYKKTFENCNTVKAKVQKLKEALEAAGIEGRPTLEKCRKLKKKREREQELASLDKSNIIGTEGRPKRNTRSNSFVSQEEDSQSQPSETLKEVKKTFSRLKGIIDSEDSE